MSWTKCKFLIIKLLNRILFHRWWNDTSAGEIEKIRGDRKLCVCLITKPLQYMNIKAAAMNSSNCNILMVVGSFIDSDKFTAHLRKHDSEWDLIYLFEQVYQAYACIAKIKKISEYWDPCDYGVKTNFFLKQLYYSGCQIKQIEEGIGNYCNNSGLSLALSHPFLAKHPWLYKMTYFWVRKLFHKISGSGDSMNHSRWVGEIHLYYPEYPKIPCRDRNTLRKIASAPYNNFIRMCEMFDLSECEFLLKMRNQKVLFIATSWDCVADYSPDEMAEYDHIIVKYHPHVKDKNCFHEEKLHYISVNAPAEILIFKLLSQGCEVTFRSEFSSSMVYLLGTPVKIEFSKGVPDFIADFWEFVKSNQSHVCDSE